MGWDKVTGINSDVGNPLNHMLWMLDYKVYGENSYVWNDKEKLHELYKSVAVNDKATYTEAFLWLDSNYDGKMKSVLGLFCPFRSRETFAKEWLKDMISEDVFDEKIWDDIYSKGFADFFLMSNLYGKLRDRGAVSEAFRVVFQKMSSTVAESLKANPVWLGVYSDDNPEMDAYRRNDDVPCNIGIEIRAPMFLVSVQTGAGGRSTSDTGYRYHGSATWESRDGESHTVLRSGYAFCSDGSEFAGPVRTAVINDFASSVSITATSVSEKIYGNNRILAYVFDNLIQKETSGK